MRVRAASIAVALVAAASGCKATLEGNLPREPRTEVPKDYGAGQEAARTAEDAEVQKFWRELFADPDLQALIRAAIDTNQELAILRQEIIVAKAEIGARRGEYIPRLGAQVGAGIEKVGEYTSQGVSDEAHDVAVNLPDFRFGLVASWEVDIWGRLRNLKQAAQKAYEASIEAKNFFVTELVAEIAKSYFELVALDKQIEIVQRNLEIQKNALEIVRQKKLAAEETELGVQRLSAEVLKNQGALKTLEQQRIALENRINFLVGRYPQPVRRNPQLFDAGAPHQAVVGLPSALLDNRPDVRRAARELEAAKLDAKAAKKKFYPSLSIDASAGYRAFNLRHFVATPASLVYDIAGGLVAPLLNRAAIKAEYQQANARQIEAVYDFERTLVRAYTEVVTQLAAIRNYAERYEKISEQVRALTSAIDMSTMLYQNAEADYMEVLLTRRDALEAELELVETKKDQWIALVELYQALGGGWKEHP
ncbi:MAG: TolC family protein [Deltaproteobacteria bacterium]|nr:MAG: TolC family protein [Deltaproteobacteria bacterium]